MTKFRQLFGYESGKITNMQGGFMVFRLWVLVAVVGLAPLHGGQSISACAEGDASQSFQSSVFSDQCFAPLEFELVDFRSPVDGDVVTDGHGSVRGVTSSHGLVEEEFDYDSRGNLVRTVFHDLTFSSSVYDVEGRMVASTNREGVTTYFVYDALGRMVGTILPDDTMPADVLDSVADILASTELADNPRTETVYDGDGRVVASVDVLGNRTVFGYDAAGRRVLVRNALGEEMRYAFNEVGNQTSVTDALGRVTEFVYDDANRLVETLFADGTSTSTEYDTLGRHVSATDQEGNVTSFSYDDLGRMVAVTDAEGHRTEYDYNERGDLLVQRDALGRETKYSYDTLGRRVGRALPEGQSESVAYNVLGNMVSRTDFNGFTTTYAYDYRSLLESVTADAGHPSLALEHAPAKFEYSYDSIGRRVSAVVKGSSNSVLHEESFSYDLRGRMVEHGSSNGDLSYGYDTNSNLLSSRSELAGGFDQSYGYDSLNRLSKVYEGSNVGSRTEIAGYSYNAVGSLASVSYANGVGHDYFYNNLNRLTGLDVASAGSGPVQQGYAYTLNQAGHRVKIEEAGGRVIDHTFDKLYRLKQETIGGAINGRNGSISYLLDSVGNRTSRSVVGEELGALLPAQSFSYSSNDLLSHHGHDANGSTTNSPQGDYPLAKDGDGNVRTGSNTDVYDFRGKLIRRVRGDNSVVDCEYATGGERVRRVVTSEFGFGLGDVRYLVDSNNHTGYAQVVEERDVDSNLTTRYFYGHDLISREDLAGVRYYYSYDGHGSVRGLTDRNGGILEEYDFDAFGVMLAFRKLDGSSGFLEEREVGDFLSESSNRYLYTGEQFDGELGMYYLRARYLNAGSGRFHTMDDYEGRNGQPITLHKYLYGNGNPVSNIDPSGYRSLAQQTATFSGVNALAGALIGGISSGYRSYVYGARGWDIVADAAQGALFGGIFGGLAGPIGIGLSQSHVVVQALFYSYFAGVTLDAIWTDIVNGHPELVALDAMLALIGSRAIKGTSGAGGSGNGNRNPNKGGSQLQTQGLGDDAINKALSNTGRGDHAARHLIDEGIINANPNSKKARDAFSDLASNILSDPIAVFETISTRGNQAVTGYLGNVDGQNIIIYIALETKGKVGIGDIVTAITPSARQLENLGL